ncbi:MAG: beta-L-arabinofuranosidase domain-containing protein [Bacteroidota bacterium]
MRSIPAAGGVTLLCALFAVAGSFAGNTANRRDYPITPVDFTAVRFTGGFWAPRLDINRTVTVPHVFRKCEETGRIDHFVFAAGIREGKYRGYQFNDSDVFKAIEGASYTLMTHPDQHLERYLDSVIAFIAAAQEPDGYLYTPKRLIRPDYAPPGGKERWVGIKDGSHELYNLGHLYEAAVAHYHATGKRTLLDVAIKSADLVCATFGPAGRGEVPGHQEIEIGLCALYRATGNAKYLAMANHFLDERGNAKTHELMGTYTQDHMPLREQKEAVGHAVRAGYMYSAMADVAALTGDPSYIPVLDRLWSDVVNGKLYVTGGIGSVGTYEGFGPSHTLPNASAYCETCASIALAFWCQRMFLTHGDAQYIDILERSLYNGLLAGIGKDGKSFFYENPLESFRGEQRPDWYACSCCPTNIVRYLPRLGGMMYAYRGGDIYITMFAAGQATIATDDGTVLVTQETGYPWDGNVRITIEPDQPAEFSVFVRIPGWARSQTVPGDLYAAEAPINYDIAISVNSTPTDAPAVKGFVRLTRRWRRGDVITLAIPMPVERIVAHPALSDDEGRFALQRGPLVYCFEGVDAPDGKVLDLYFPDTTKFRRVHRPDLLSGVEMLRGTGIAVKRTLDGSIEPAGTRAVAAIPYYAWAHRGRSEMTVWAARRPATARPMPAPTLAWKSTATASQNLVTDPVKDQLLPHSSNDPSVPYIHWWPKKGTTEWVQYEFPSPETISRAGIYWFDDTGAGQCRVPRSWKILYKDGDDWKAVKSTLTHKPLTDTMNIVEFEPVTTTAVRLEVTSQPDFSAGLYEWTIQ